MSLLEIVEREYNNLGMVKIPYLVERLCSSITCHIINKFNLLNKKFYHAGSLYNFRTHVILMSPSGWVKSTTARFFLSPRDGILSRTKTIPTTVRSTFTPESWVGTLYQDNDEEGKKIIKKSRGIFGKYKFGIVAADEFMRLKDLAESTIPSNELVYLLSGLDNDVITKDMAIGSVDELNIGTTLWPGMRLTTLDTSSGLLRRFSYHLFFPTIKDARKFKTAIRDKRIGKPISEITKDKVRDEIEGLENIIADTESLDLLEIEKYLNGSMLVPHFEEHIYKKMAIGYSLASGTFPDIILDERLKGLLQNEFYNRNIVRTDPEREAIYHCVKSSEKPLTVKELETFFRYHYSMPYERFRLKFSSLVSYLKKLYIEDNVVKVYKA